MKGDVLIRKSLRRHFNDAWTWKLIVWKKPGIFAHITVDSTCEFTSKQEAVEDMNDTIRFFNLDRFEDNSENVRLGRINGLDRR